MERRCDYCLMPSDELKIVNAVERASGPPFVLRACPGCMESEGLKPWRE